MARKNSGAEKKGFTLVELLAVVAILAVVAVVAVTKIGGMAELSRIAAAQSDMAAIRAALVDGEVCYLRDMVGLAGFSPADMRLANILMPTNLFGLARSSGGAFPRARRIDDIWLGEGTARPEEFTEWSEERSRGWRGPYVRGRAGAFPSRDEAAERGFYPDVSSLYLPEYFAHRSDVSIYGIPGEPALLDPWGQPYVLQIPPPQAFTNANVTAISPEKRFEFARIVCAGPDGKIDTPCFFVNPTNDVTISLWNERTRRIARQAGLIDGSDRFLRGDDIVLFIMRNDFDEE